MNSHKKSPTEATIQKGDFLTLKIEKIVFGGEGLARHQGMVIFVSQVLAGETVKVLVTSIKKNLARAELKEVLEASSSRVTPKCPVFGTCGGCDWQHMNYAEQADIKNSWLIDFFRKDLAQGTQIKPFLQSPSIWNYRNRISLKKIDHEIGFYEKNSHRLVPIEYCHIAEDAINESLSRINRHKKSNSNPETIRISSQPLSPLDLENQDAFSQVNTGANQLLLTAVQNIFESQGTFENFYDFYSGSGNFSLALHKSHPHVNFIAVESSPESIALGRQYLKQNGVENIDFLNLDAADYFKRNSILKSSMVLIDPPREGCSVEFIQSLASQDLESVCYVSCNPTTALRDWDRLQQLSQQKLKLVSIQGLDMFPQTSHIEVILEIKASPY